MLLMFLAATTIQPAVSPELTAAYDKVVQDDKLVDDILNGTQSQIKCVVGELNSTMPTAMAQKDQTISTANAMNEASRKCNFQASIDAAAGKIRVKPPPVNGELLGLVAGALLSQSVFHAYIAGGMISDK
jgi:hypothetical protein